MANTQRRSLRTVNFTVNGDTVSFDWRQYLISNPNTKGIPAWRFYRHVPLTAEMKQIMDIEDCRVQVKLKPEEVPVDPYVEGKEVYWFAKTKEYFGYMAKIVYDQAQDKNCEELTTRIINFMLEAKSMEFTKVRKDISATCFPSTYRWVWEKPEVAQKRFDWSMFITNMLNLYGEHTNVTNFTYGDELNGDFIWNCNLIHVNEVVEVLNKSCISQMRVAYVLKIVGGRLHLRYWDSNAKPGEADFVCHELSDAVYSRGWSRAVGHSLSAPEGYVDMYTMMKDPLMLALMRYDISCHNIREGMWLEIVDPLFPSLIVAAQISKVLKYGYVMVTIRRRHSTTTKCYHVTSPMLLYCGFCERFGVPLVKPLSYHGKPTMFCWETFLNDTNGMKLVIREIHTEDETDYGIEKNMKLEAVDLMEPSHICVATVSDVKGRLLKIRFDGWGKKYDQWMPVSSTELYPMGWCEVNGYPLRAPGELFELK